MSAWFHKPGSQPNSPGEDGSAKESADAFKQGLTEHLKARADLFALEAREAGELAARKSVFAIVAALLLLFAYALLLVGAVALLGTWLERSWTAFDGIGWQLVTIAAGLLHAALALAIARKLPQKPNPPIFEFTRAEFQKDRLWLQQKQNPPNSKNDSSP